MKTTSATVKLYLRVAKTLSDGTNPIHLKVSWKGSKEQSTSFSCIPRYWDAKRECVKKGYPNYNAINAAITKLKNEVIARRDEYELNGVVYTPSMLLKSDEATVVNPKGFNAIVEAYSVALSPTTKKTWKSFKTSFLEYLGKDDIMMSEIGLDTLKGYGKWLEDKKLKGSTIKMTLAKLAALLKYSVEEGLIKESPFKRWNYGKQYKVSSNNVFIHHRSIEIMKELFLDEIIVRNGQGWSYKDDSYDKLLDRNSDVFARYFWFMGYLFQGMSPIDLCQVKINDIKVITVDGVDYYAYDSVRQKTNIPIKIRIKVHTMYSQVMIKTMLMFRKGYLLPILDGCPNDRLKIYKCVSNWLSNHIDKFRDWIKEVVNPEIVKRNVTNNDNIPLIMEDVTYYSYRHSFAQSYLQKGGDIISLATLLGRSPDTISTYVEQLSTDTDLAKAVSIMD